MELTTRTLTSLLGLAFVVALVYGIIQFKYTNVEEEVYSGNGMTVSQMKKELDCLAINIYREAGYEPIEGRIAVAQVTMNRVEHPNFPNTVCGVVYEKSLITSRVICQFSWYCDSTHRNRRVNEAAYQESYEVAKKVLLENFRLSSLEKALFYHADYVNPNWKLERINQIGQHIFYKPKEQRSTKLAGA